MSRKLAAVVTSVTAIVMVVGALIALALVQSNQPNPTVAVNTTPTVVPSGTPSRPSTTPSTPRGKGSPLADPTAAAAAGNATVLFFTFDDGPDRVWTPKILHVLRKYGAHATFFQLDSMVGAHPALREQILASGNTIGNHSISHPQLTAISAARRHHEIFDGPPSKCFRPPYGASNPKVRAEIKAAGMTEVLWNTDPRDWAKPGATAIAKNILRHAHRRNIILLHDGGGDRGQTVAALDKVLPILKAQGYSFPAMAC